MVFVVPRGWRGCASLSESGFSGFAGFSGFRFARIALFAIAGIPAETNTDERLLIGYARPKNPANPDSMDFPAALARFSLLALLSSDSYCSFR